MKNFQLLIVLLLICIAMPGFAQEVEIEKDPKVAIAGSVYAYYRANINAPNKGEFAQTPATSFDNLSGFSLGMANLISIYEGKKVGFVADLVFGTRGEDAVFGSPPYTGGLAGSSQVVISYTFIVL